LVTSSASAGSAAAAAASAGSVAAVAAAAAAGHVHVDTGGTTDQACGESVQGIADTANMSSCSLDRNLL